MNDTRRRLVLLHSFGFFGTDWNTKSNWFIERCLAFPDSSLKTIMLFGMKLLNKSPHLLQYSFLTSVLYCSWMRIIKHYSFDLVIYNLSESVVAGVHELSSQSQLLSLIRTQDTKDISYVQGNTGKFIETAFFALEEHTNITYLDEVIIKY